MTVRFVSPLVYSDVVDYAIQTNLMTQLRLWKNMWLGRGSNTDQTAHEPLPAETLTTELLVPSRFFKPKVDSQRASSLKNKQNLTW